MFEIIIAGISFFETKLTDIMQKRGISSYILQTASGAARPTSFSEKAVFHCGDYRVLHLITNNPFSASPRATTRPGLYVLHRYPAEGFMKRNLT